MDKGNPLFLSLYGIFARLIVDKKLLSSRDSKPSVLKIVLISLAGATSGVALVVIVARCVCR